jgi:hypothetical protein
MNKQTRLGMVRVGVILGIMGLLCGVVKLFAALTSDWLTAALMLALVVYVWRGRK